MSDAAEWDERYGEAPIWSGRPNGALVAEVADLTPRRALEVGCGEGADAVWLAQRGWQVTALDPSAVALDRARRHARRSATEVDWQLGSLAGFEIPPGGFDLVSAQYPALPSTPGDDAIHALLAAVAVGGTLLVVHHADVDTELARSQGFDPADYVLVPDVRRALTDAWDVVLDERRARDVRGGAGAHHTHDLVLRARRRR